MVSVRVADAVWSRLASKRQGAQRCRTRSAASEAQATSQDGRSEVRGYGSQAKSVAMSVAGLLRGERSEPRFWPR